MTTTPETPALPGDLTDETIEPAHRPEPFPVYIDPECGALNCEHEGECPARDVLVCKECLRIAEAASPGWAESRFDIGLVAWPCAAARVAPAPALTDETIERAAKALHDRQWRNSDLHPRWGERGHCMSESGHRAEVIADVTAVLAAARIAPVTPSEWPECDGCEDMGPEGERCPRHGLNHAGLWAEIDRLRSMLVPSPDREKPEVFDVLRNLLGTYIYPSIINTGRGDINDAQAATTELAEAVLALFAVPPVVNKAKLAEVFGQALPADCAVTTWQARELASAADERQREWLGTAR